MTGTNCSRWVIKKRKRPEARGSREVGMYLVRVVGEYDQNLLCEILKDLIKIFKRKKKKIVSLARGLRLCKAIKLSACDSSLWRINEHNCRRL